MIEVAAVCVQFDRFRFPQNDIEERIHGDDGEIMLAPRYLCEPCGDLFFSLEELGYCVSPDENMRELVAQYAVMKGEKEKAA